MTFPYRCVNGALILFLLLCSSAFAQPNVASIAANELQATLQEIVRNECRSLPTTLLPEECASLNALYQRRNYTPFWIQDGKLKSQGSAILIAMRGADQVGLDPADYGIADIDSALSTLSSGDSAQKRIAQIDLSISSSAFKFVSHLHLGRVQPSTAGFDLPSRSKAFDASAVLERLSSASDPTTMLASLEPAFQHYRFLKGALAHYRTLAMRTPPLQLPPLTKTSVKVGDRYEGVPNLRAFLIALGDLAPGNDENLDEKSSVLDEMLSTALKRFQFRHGLRQDGALGKKTYAALITPLSQRVRQIELTLERWRWLPQLDGPTIIVNIPQFRLFAFSSNEDSEAQMLRMNVIVGKTYRETRTPVFVADMKYVVFRPYWDVPYKIMKNEMLARIRKEPNYLARENFEVVPTSANTPALDSDIASGLESGRLRVRQKPGVDNALGLIKFGIPNKYDVYLHSTPFDELFRESRRTFSHGCIRVRDPVALAEYVLKHAAESWSHEEIEAAMNGTDNQRVELREWIRVLIVYGTAIASESGAVHFFDDIYGNDARLEMLLAASH